VRAERWTAANVLKGDGAADGPGNRCAVRRPGGGDLEAPRLSARRQDGTPLRRNLQGSGASESPRVRRHTGGGNRQGKGSPGSDSHPTDGPRTRQHESSHPVTPTGRLRSPLPLAARRTATRPPPRTGQRRALGAADHCRGRSPYASKPRRSPSGRAVREDGPPDGMDDHGASAPIAHGVRSQPLMLVKMNVNSSGPMTRRNSAVPETVPAGPESVTRPRPANSRSPAISCVELSRKWPRTL
jgi:hypothetical protein